MAAGDLTAAQFDLAFDFGRSETASFRDATGALQVAAVNVARFDHDALGAPLGLLVSAGAEIGGADRAVLDPLILPLDLLEPAAEATIFHSFDDGTGIQRRAWYSRDARATIDALLAQVGHHIEIGVIRGLRQPELAAEGEIVRYRGAVWLLPELLIAGDDLLADTEDRPLIRSGAEPS